MHLHPFLNTAVRAARLAGTVIMRHFDNLDKLVIQEKGVNDLVTAADHAAEAIIIDTIQKAYPEHSILGEENGYIAGNEFTWVIDPIDGTMNYAHGFPQFAVSIAIKFKDQIEHAVVFDPFNQDLYTATKGGGAQLNNRRIRISARDTLKNALIGSALPSPRQYSKESVQKSFNLFHALFEQEADFRKVGSAALNLAYVAAGRLDGFFEPNLKEWDIAAGVLLVREAGGFVSDFSGENTFLESGNIVAGTRKIHAELLELLAKA